MDRNGDVTCGVTWTLQVTRSMSGQDNNETFVLAASFAHGPMVNSLTSEMLTLLNRPACPPAPPYVAKCS